MSWAGKQNATAEGTQEEVWALRRGKAPLLGRSKGGGVGHHGNLPGLVQVLRGQDASGTGYRW